MSTTLARLGRACGPAMRRALAALGALLIAGLIASCQLGARAAAAPVPGTVTDLRAFEAFLAEKPEPPAFRRRYPDVQLVLPGEPATKELRFDRSRFFAELDDQGRIVGGRFR